MLDRQMGDRSYLRHAGRKHGLKRSVDDAFTFTEVCTHLCVCEWVDVVGVLFFRGAFRDGTVIRPMNEVGRGRGAVRQKPSWCV